MNEPEAWAYELRITLGDPILATTAQRLSEKIDEALAQVLRDINAEIVQGELYTY